MTLTSGLMDRLYSWRYAMMRMWSLSWILGLLCMIGLVGMGTGVSTAHAQSRAQYQKQMKSYKDQLETLAEKDEWGVSEKTRKRARQWLEDAEVLMARGDTEMGALVIEQVGDAIELIRALISKKKMEASAEKQEKTYYKRKEETIPELEEEIQQLKSRKQELERELETLQSN